MRNKNIDIIRTGALILMVIYHAWVVCGTFEIENAVISIIIKLGGEIGVTAFFALSGYGIYCSLRNSDIKEKISFGCFIKKRLIRIAPQYYLSLIVVLLFGAGAVYLSWDHKWNLITHVFFVHNLFPEYSGAINGVLWTMGTIMQFYIIAIPLYKGTKKWGVGFWMLTVVFTIVMKALVYAYILPMYTVDSSLYFLYGRQLLTSLDNFTVGMIVAHLVTSEKYKINKWIAPIGTIIAMVALYVVCRMGTIYGIHTNNKSGYVWHSAIAICIGLIMYFFTYIPINPKNILAKVLIWISKYEYGVYLWHLVMFTNLVNNSGCIVYFLNNGQQNIAILIMIIIAMFIGVLFTKMTDALMKDILEKKRS